MVEQVPQWDTLVQIFPTLAQKVLAQVPPGDILSLQLCPFDVIEAVYPVTPVNLEAMGLDTEQLSTVQVHHISCQLHSQP